MLQSPVAILTGATGGIGRALAHTLDERGYRLLVHGFDTVEAGKELQDSLKCALYFDSDLSTQEGAMLLAQETRETFGRIDLLVNNAAVGIPLEHGNIAGVTPEFFQLALSVNLLGPWFMTQACAPDLRDTRGSVINMSSMAASTVSGSSIPYAVSKAGLEHLTRLLAVAMGPEVRVNALAPGLVDTERTRAWEHLRKEVIQSSPMRRSGTPEDVARACMSLIDSPYTTGATLPVDGGQRLV
ncbi:SDR family NAD(P)-dependent oxidoreductase [Nesterenkonia lutea]|uniref:Ketoreductase RED2 n=1 Tax=Nesterenkonia lutea TaxID=272919 RepID=A0ABR9JEL6_9MICC|nr:ketoreductase RED2 [Nesterenkonia lutea]